MMTGIILVCVTIAIFIIMESVREQSSFRITSYQLKSDKLKLNGKEVVIVLLGDLHNHCYGKENERLLSAIQNQKPDAILVSGDMIVGHKGVSTEVGCSFMEQLPFIAPVYYANGNHEQRMKEQPQVYGEKAYFNYEKRLQSAGIHILENKTIHVNIKGAKIGITGLELPLCIYRKFEKTIITKKDIIEQVGEITDSNYRILIAHNPVHFPAYKEWGADLTVSGHLHGGLVRLPFIGGVITPQAWLFPKHSGELTVENNQAIAVTKGLGNHTVNLRILNHPEVVTLHLRGKEEPGKENI